MSVGESCIQVLFLEGFNVYVFICVCYSVCECVYVRDCVLDVCLCV